MSGICSLINEVYSGSCELAHLAEAVLWFVQIFSIPPFTFCLAIGILIYSQSHLFTQHAPASAPTVPANLSPPKPQLQTSNLHPQFNLSNCAKNLHVDQSLLQIHHISFYALHQSHRPRSSQKNPSSPDCTQTPRKLFDFWKKIKMRLKHLKINLHA